VEKLEKDLKHWVHNSNLLQTIGCSKEVSTDRRAWWSSCPACRGRSPCCCSSLSLPRSARTPERTCSPEQYRYRYRSKAEYQIVSANFVLLAGRYVPYRCILKNQLTKNKKFGILRKTRRCGLLNYSYHSNSVPKPKRLFQDPEPTFQKIPDLSPAPDLFSDPGQNQIF